VFSSKRKKGGKKKAYWCVHSILYNSLQHFLSMLIPKAHNPFCLMPMMRRGGGAPTLQQSTMMIVPKEEWAAGSQHNNNAGGRFRHYDMERVLYNRLV
jgi:hypothetical protein